MTITKMSVQSIHPPLAYIAALASLIGTPANAAIVKCHIGRTDYAAYGKFKSVEGGSDIWIKFNNNSLYDWNSQVGGWGADECQKLQCAIASSGLSIIYPLGGSDTRKVTISRLTGE
jgi:hypothetical protein